MTKRFKDTFPTLLEILEGAKRFAAEEGWDLRKTMIYVQECTDDYWSALGNELAEILVITQTNEDEATARSELLDEAHRWEGNNNG